MVDDSFATEGQKNSYEIDWKRVVAGSQFKERTHLIVIRVGSTSVTVKPIENLNWIAS